jgi:acyl-CoA thioester hydrolase
VGLAEEVLSVAIVYQKSMMAGWADVDANAHMRNVAYLDKSVDLRFQFFAEQGVAVEAFRSLAARVTSTGGWLDLKARRLIAPPVALLAALRLLARTEDFAALPSSLRSLSE